MIANASHFTTPPHIEYTLTPSQQGWRLTIWEEAAVTEKRVRPFLWKFGVEIATLSEVNFILQSILGNSNSDSDGDEGSECRDTLEFQKN